MRKLLLVVDYQKDFVDGSAGFLKAKGLEDGIYNKILEYKNNGEHIIFTYDTHTKGYLETREGKNFPIIHCQKGEEGHELYGKIKEFSKGSEKILHIEKRSFGMSPEALCEIKKDFGEFDVIECVGIVTNMCLISNVILMQSAYPNADIIVHGNMCASFDDSLHEKALDLLESIHIRVLNR